MKIVIIFAKSARNLLCKIHFIDNCLIIQVSRIVWYYNDLGGSGKGLGHLMLALPDLSVLELGYNWLKASDIEDMADVLRGHSQGYIGGYTHIYS